MTIKLWRLQNDIRKRRCLRSLLTSTQTVNHRYILVCHYLSWKCNQIGFWWGSLILVKLSLLALNQWHYYIMPKHLSDFLHGKLFLACVIDTFVMQENCSNIQQLKQSRDFEEILVRWGVNKEAFTHVIIKLTIFEVQKNNIFRN